MRTEKWCPARSCTPVKSDRKQWGLGQVAFILGYAGRNDNEYMTHSALKVNDYSMKTLHLHHNCNTAWSDHVSGKVKWGRA